MESLFGKFDPLLVLLFVLGLVELIKKLGAKGNRLMVISVIIGAGLGGLYQVGVLYPALQPWLSVLVYGGLTGLAASGLYDLGKRFTGAKNDGSANGE